MQNTITDTLRTPAVVPHQQHQRPPVAEPPQDRATVTDNARQRRSTEDYVTLSSRPDSGDPATGKNQSQPVSSNEKQALLKPNATQYRFSVYG
jgi:hypothetical protein